MVSVKGKVAILRLERRQGAHLPHQGREPIRGNTTVVCDAWPVRHQMYRYLPSLRWYKTDTAWWQRHMCMNSLERLQPKVPRPGIEPVSCWTQVQRLITMPPSHTQRISGLQKYLTSTMQKDSLRWPWATAPNTAVKQARQNNTGVLVCVYSSETRNGDLTLPKCPRPSTAMQRKLSIDRLWNLHSIKIIDTTSTKQL